MPVEIKLNPARCMIYRRGGEAVETFKTDANYAVGQHPSEWSFTPWPAEPVAALDQPKVEPKIAEPAPTRRAA